MVVGELIRTRGGIGRSADSAEADPITTEVIRHGLNAASEQMKITLRRTAFSPVIYEMVDFACGLFDPQVRMLSQARALPQFLGTLSFCVEAAIDAVGGRDNLAPGDVIWSTNGYANGSHSQDAVVMMPAFWRGELAGFAAVKAHHLDIAAKDPYCTDTTDNFQEGVNFPGVKLYRAGVLERDMWRTVLANSRLPDALEGDLNAQIAAGTIGISALVRLIEKYGRDSFWPCVERMYDHGEAVMRRLIAGIPDGQYSARGALDNDGISDDPVSFEVTVEVKASDIVVDFSKAPPETAGPVNCPLPTTVSTARLSIMSLLGSAEELPNEGHFRPIEVITRPGTLFHPRPPAPIFLYGWAGDQATEGIHRAMSAALPKSVPAGSGGDLCGLTLWGQRVNGDFWAGGMDHIVGHGASYGQDGSSPMIIISCSGIRNTPCEVIENRYPLKVERYELAADSAGAGQWRGGAGVDFNYEVLSDLQTTAIFERSKNPGWGLFGGLAGRANRLVVRYPDHRSVPYMKVTALKIPAGAQFVGQTGGGGGYGPPSDRDVAAVHHDIANGYISEDAARRDYPHAFERVTERAASSDGTARG